MGLVYITTEQFDEYKNLKRQDFEQSHLEKTAKRLGYLLNNLSDAISSCRTLALELRRINEYQREEFNRDIVKRLPFYDEFLKSNEIPFGEMSVRLRNSLKGHGIEYWTDIKSKTKSGVSHLRTLGRKSMAELCAIMDKYSIKFKDEE